MLVGYADRYTRVGCEPRLADRVDMHKPYTLEMVHMSLSVIREDHFQRISLEQPSDGPIMISILLNHSGGHWPTSVCEVQWGHISACIHQGLCISVVVLLPTS